MALQYNDEMKEMITMVLEEAIDGRSLFYQPPEKISFEETEYKPQDFLVEVKKRSQVGERALHYIHNKASLGLEEQLQRVEDPNEPFFGHENLDGSETTYSIRDMVSSMRTQTENGKELLQQYLRLNVPEFFPLVQMLKSGETRSRLKALWYLLETSEPAVVFNMLASLTSGSGKIKMADYDAAIKSGKLDYEEVLLDAILT